MTIEECYKEIGSNYEDVLRRFVNERFVRKFVIKFKDDRSFSSLLTAMENEDEEAALLAAHTLKGVSLNLGFTNLYEASSQLTQALKNEHTTKGKEEMLDEVKTAYEKTISAIGKL